MGAARGAASAEAVALGPVVVATGGVPVKPSLGGDLVRWRLAALGADAAGTEVAVGAAATGIGGGAAFGTICCVWAAVVGGGMTATFAALSPFTFFCGGGVESLPGSLGFAEDDFLGGMASVGCAVPASGNAVHKVQRC